MSTSQESSLTRGRVSTADTTHKGDRTSSRGGATGYKRHRSRLFTEERNRWLVAQLRNPNVTSVLKERTAYSRTIPSKILLFEQVAREFNTAFQLECTSVQVKCRIDLILRHFKRADQERVRMANSNMNGHDRGVLKTGQRKEISKMCPEYFDLEDVWSVVHHQQLPPPPVPPQANPQGPSTNNTARVRLTLGSVGMRPKRPPPSLSAFRIGGESVESTKEEDEEDMEVEEREEVEEEQKDGEKENEEEEKEEGDMEVEEEEEDEEVEGEEDEEEEDEEEEEALIRRRPRQAGNENEKHLSGVAPELPTTAQTRSIADAVERLTEASLSLVTLHAAKSKNRQHLDHKQQELEYHINLKQQELEYHLNLKRMENEHELRKLELQRDMEIRKQEHEKQMMALHLKLHLKTLGHSKEGQAQQVNILEDRMSRYVLQRHDPESETGDSLNDVASSTEPVTRTFLGSPPKTPRIPVDVHGQNGPISQKKSD